MPRKKKVKGYVPDPKRNAMCDCEHARWHHSIKKCCVAFCRCQGFYDITLSVDRGENRMHK
jgi:hypothetical protein